MARSNRLAASRRPASSLMRDLAALAFCSALAACASVPDFDQDVDPLQANASPSPIIGARGPLSERQSKAVLEKISTEPGDAGVLKRHLAIEEAVAESPLVAGNHTRLLRDGPQSFQAIFAAIAGARKQVNLEYFTLEDVESDGVHLGDLLAARRQAGVEVNVIYDSFGSSNTPQAFFDRLKQAGVTIVEFNPINPLDAKNSYSLNGRDHRKILVADGATAIVGGVNLSTAYQSSPMGASTVVDGKPIEYWRDTDLEIKGPVVAQVQALFVAHWNQQKGPPISAANFYPTVPSMGDGVVRIIGSTPEHAIPRYYVTLLSSIRNAERRVYLSAAYFVPTHQEMEDLIHAARRGVDVRLLLPDQSDSSLAITVAHSRYSDLLEAGVKIYETHNIVLHSKTVVIDGVWSVIGSSNFDQRSVLFNDEIDAVVLGSETAQQLEAMFEQDQAAARQVDLTTLENRPTADKVKGLFSRIWQSLL